VVVGWTVWLCVCACMFLLSLVGGRVCTVLLGGVRCMYVAVVKPLIERKGRKKKEKERKEKDVFVHMQGHHCRDVLCLVLDSAAHSMFLYTLHILCTNMFICVIHTGTPELGIVH